MKFLKRSHSYEKFGVKPKKTVLIGIFNWFQALMTYFYNCNHFAFRLGLHVGIHKWF